METWYFLDSGANSAAFNMALDEKLMDWHREKLMPPIVRFYEWNPAALSIGYFQKIHKEINIEVVKDHELELIRRSTGGRAVLHDDELTYSVIVSENHPHMPKTVTEAYRVISQGLLEGYRYLGLDTKFSVPKTEEERKALKEPRSSVCFDAPSWYELVVEGRKIAGSAQTRQNNVILQHGSLIRSIDEDKLFDLFLFPHDKVKERMKKGFKNKAVAITELTEKNISIADMKVAFKAGFEKGLSITLESYSLSEEQKKEVNGLIESKYNTQKWNEKF